LWWLHISYITLCNFIIIIIITLFAQRTQRNKNSELLDSTARQHGSKKATLIVAREEKMKYTQNYTKLDKTIELTLDITKI